MQKERLPRNRKMIDKQVTRETNGKEVRNRLRRKREKIIITIRNM